MSIKNRKEREREEMRNLILRAASGIIKTEGMDNLSIRKIAATIDYSPAIVYHYFHDKDEIVNQLMGQGYQKIIGVLSILEKAETPPEQRLRDTTRNYILMALGMPEEYLAIMLSNSPRTLKNTSILPQGASQERPTIAILCRVLKELFPHLGDDHLELTAQIYWTSLFGLIIRLIIERDIEPEQREKLIDHHIEIMVEGLILQLRQEVNPNE